MLVIGGAAGIGIVVNIVELYDLSTGKWSATSNTTYKRVYHTASVLKDGKVLVTGGKSNDGTIFNTAEIYDPSKGKWTITGNLSVARYLHVASVLIDGSVLVTGGENNEVVTPPLYIAELYDPSTGNWTVIESLINPRIDHATCVLKDGKVLAIGGVGELGLLSSAELYDPSTGHWTITGSLNQMRMLSSACLLTDGRVLVIGGSLFEGVHLNSTEFV